MPFSDTVRSRLDADAAQIIGQYPGHRSALLPLLHLVQSEEGYVSEDGIEYCADKLGLTEAEVTGVVSFYTMYKRRPVGEYHVGVCTNTVCGVLGGNQILAGFNDDQATEGPTAGPADLVGLKIAKEHGWTAPEPGRAGDKAGDHAKEPR